ncbi:hypothetical protein Hdeb2414_s0015g00446221 [Helianthus debilis subsp. tardiflorus]
MVNAIMQLAGWRIWRLGLGSWFVFDPGISMLGIGLLVIMSCCGYMQQGTLLVSIVLQQKLGYDVGQNGCADGRLLMKIWRIKNVAGGLHQETLIRQATIFYL